MKDIPLSDLKLQHNNLRKELHDALDEVINVNKLIKGPILKRFEENLAKFIGKKYAIGLKSGTAALHLALIASGVKKGDEVITVPHTFIGTSEPVSYIGAKIKFVDIDEKTYNMDVNQLQKAITKKTKAIIPVHLYGNPCDMDAIYKIAKDNNIKVIEDCAQALGSQYKGKNVPVGDIGCFSMFPAKNLGTLGDAGFIVTDGENFAKKIKMLRDHGRSENAKYEHKIEGYNERLDAIHAAFLDVKLKYLNQWIENRRKIAELYNNKLKNTELILPYADKNNKASYYMYVIRTKSRDKLQERLKEKGVETGIHYPLPLHLQPAYKHLGYKKGDFPVTEKICKEILSLPMYPEMTEEQVNYVVDSIKEFL